MALEMLARHQGATAPVKNIDYQSRQTSKAHTVDDQNRSHERHSPQTAAPTDRASSRQMKQRWLNVLIVAREKLSSQINSGIHGEDRSIAQRRFAKVSALIGKARLLDENDPQSIMGAIPHARDLENRLASDLEYVRNWSPWLDIKIILKTFGVLVHPNAF